MYPNARKDVIGMDTASTTIQLDPQLKREATELLDTFGLSLSSAVSLFLRQTVREGAIPFRIGQPAYNEETRKAILDAKKGIGLSRPFASAEEMFEELDDGEIDGN